LTILSWLQDLSMKNREYSCLFARLAFQKARLVYQSFGPRDEAPSLARCLQQKVSVDDDPSFFPQILLSKSLVTSLTEKLQIIEKTLANKGLVSAQILFEEISPVLGKYYRKLRFEFSDVEEAEKALWEKQKNGINYSEAKSLLSPEGVESGGNNKNGSDEDLLPEMFQDEYKKKLIAGESPLDQFIRRHSQRNRRNLLNLREVLEELKFLVQEDLTGSGSIQDVVDFWYNISRRTDSDTEENLSKEITLLLSSLPNA